MHTVYEVLRWCAVGLGVVGMAVGLWLLQYRPQMRGTVWKDSRHGGRVTYLNWVILVGLYLFVLGVIVSDPALPFVLGAGLAIPLVMLVLIGRGLNANARRRR